ncbi:unnamed protein product, partial [Litomosoides sigmodontis]
VMNTEMMELDQNDGMVQYATTPKMVKREKRCCCSLLRVTTATVLIGLLELCYFSYEIISIIYHFVQTGEQYFLSLSISLFGMLLAFIASILLFIAVKTSIPYLLVPHLLMQVAIIFVLLIVCLFCIFAVMAGTSLDFGIVSVDDSIADDLALSMTGNSTYELIYTSQALSLFLSLTCIFLLLLGLLQVWLLIIVFRCFSYLQEEAILKAQRFNGNSDVNRLRARKRQNSATVAAKDNFFPLEMNSTKFIRNN